MRHSQKKKKCSLLFQGYTNIFFNSFKLNKVKNSVSQWPLPCFKCFIGTCGHCLPSWTVDSDQPSAERARAWPGCRHPVTALSQSLMTSFLELPLSENGWPTVSLSLSLWVPQAEVWDSIPQAGVAPTLTPAPKCQSLVNPGTPRPWHCRPGASPPLQGQGQVCQVELALGEAGTAE